jgi:hypothetical protein
MGYLGYKPADKPLTAADITDSIITSAKIVDGTIVNADINASAGIVASKLSGTGKVLQVIQTHYTGTFTKTQSASVSDITDFNVTITPSSTSSKILCIVDVNIGFSATTADTTDDPYPYLLLLRGATSIGLGTGASSNRINTFLSAPSVPGTTDNKTNYKILNVSKTYLDSPSTTSATTYKLQLGNPFESNSIAYINRQDATDDNSYIQFPSSCLTLMEVLP